MVDPQERECKRRAEVRDRWNRENWARFGSKITLRGWNAGPATGAGTNWMDLRNGKPLWVLWKKGRGRKASPGRPGD